MTTKLLWYTQSTLKLKSRILGRSTRFSHSSYLQLVRRFSNAKGESKPQVNETTPEHSRGLQLSDSCVERLRKLFADDKNSFLRVSVEGGGCSGYKYTFDIDTEIAEDDRIIERNGARIIVDEVSLGFLRGSTIDYHEELIRSAFRVSLNPRAEKGCSCGSSFTFKLE